MMSKNYWLKLYYVILETTIQTTIFYIPKINAAYLTNKMDLMRECLNWKRQKTHCVHIKWFKETNKSTFIEGYTAQRKCYALKHHCNPAKDEAGASNWCESTETAVTSECVVVASSTEQSHSYYEECTGLESMSV